MNSEEEASLRKQARKRKSKHEKGTGQYRSSSVQYFFIVKMYTQTYINTAHTQLHWQLTEH